MFFLQSLNSKEPMPKRHIVASGCFFEPEEEVVPNPIVGRKKGSVDFDDTLYRRRSELEDIPDDFASRMMSMGQVESGGLNKEVKMPQDFTVTVAYNKGGYQVVPKDDLKE